MARDRKKKKNCKSGRTNDSQSHKIKSTVNSENKDKQGNKIQNDIVKFGKDHTSVLVKSVKNCVINTLYRSQGFSDASIARFHKDVIINQIKRFQFSEFLCPFDRRITAISWHPTYSKIFIAGSKGGDLLLHNLSGRDDYFSSGVGAAGSIFGLKCSDEDPYSIYTASLTGKICLTNLQDERKSKMLYSLPLTFSLPLNNWFTCLDICKSRKFLLTGDCRGNVYVLSTSGKPIFPQKRLHTSKVTHCEFNTHDPDIFVTSSLDRSVKLWDLRTFSNSTSKYPEPIAEFPHEKAVSSAYFSPSNGISILTTDQYSELRVYSSPLWNEIVKITHPHRQFQHMTHIKAIWHPLEDIIIVGRYPDDNIQIKDYRAIDFYDGSNGQLLHQIPSPNMNIVSLNAMNSTGEVLATAAGFGIALLKDELVLKKDRSEPESGEDVENPIFNLCMKKKKKSEVRASKSVCPKKSSYI